MGQFLCGEFTSAVISITPITKNKQTWRSARNTRLTARGLNRLADALSWYWRRDPISLTGRSPGTSCVTSAYGWRNAQYNELFGMVCRSAGPKSFIRAGNPQHIQRSVPIQRLPSAIIASERGESHYRDRKIFCNCFFDVRWSILTSAKFCFGKTLEHEFFWLQTTLLSEDIWSIKEES